MSDERPIRTKPEDSAPPPDPQVALDALAFDLRNLARDTSYLLDVLSRPGSPVEIVDQARGLASKLAIGADEAVSSRTVLNRSLRYHGYPTAGNAVPDVGVR